MTENKSTNYMYSEKHMTRANLRYIFKTYRDKQWQKKRRGVQVIQWAKYTSGCLFSYLVGPPLQLLSQGDGALHRYALLV